MRVLCRVKVRASIGEGKAKMYNGRSHVPLWNYPSMPSMCKRKISSAKVQLYYSVIIRIYLTSVLLKVSVVFADITISGRLFHTFRIPRGAWKNFLKS